MNRTSNIGRPPEIVSRTTVGFHSSRRIMSIPIYAIAAELNFSKPIPLIYAPGCKRYLATFAYRFCGHRAAGKLDTITIARLQRVVPLHKSAIRIFRWPAPVERVVPTIEVHLKAKLPLFQVRLTENVLGLFSYSCQRRR